MIHIHTHNIYIHIYVQMNFSIGESQKHSEVKQPGTKEYIPYDPIFIKSRDDQTNSDRKQIHAFLGLCVQVGVSRGVTEVSVAMQTPQSSSVMWLDRGTHLRELSSSILSTRACQVVQSCPTLNSRNCIPAGSSVHGISQVSTLEWVAISSSRGSFLPRDRTHISCISCVGR